MHRTPKIRFAFIALINVCDNNELLHSKRHILITLTFKFLCATLHLEHNQGGRSTSKITILKQSKDYLVLNVHGQMHFVLSQSVLSNLC